MLPGCRPDVRSDPTTIASCASFRRGAILASPSHDGRPPGPPRPSGPRAARCRAPWASGERTDDAQDVGLDLDDDTVAETATSGRPPRSTRDGRPAPRPSRSAPSSRSSASTASATCPSSACATLRRRLRLLQTPADAAHSCPAMRLRTVPLPRTATPRRPVCTRSLRRLPSISRWASTIPTARLA